MALELSKKYGVMVWDIFILSAFQIHVQCKFEQ